jgi:hypothetical protein
LLHFRDALVRNDLRCRNGESLLDPSKASLNLIVTAF